MKKKKKIHTKKKKKIPGLIIPTSLPFWGLVLMHFLSHASFAFIYVFAFEYVLVLVVGQDILDKRTFCK